MTPSPTLDMPPPLNLARLTDWGARRPGRLLALMLAVLAPLFVAVAGLRPDNSLGVWFVRDDPALVAYRAFLSTFGSDEGIVVAYEAEGWNAVERALQERLVARLDAIEGVDGVLAASALPDDSDSLRAALGVQAADGSSLAVLARMDAGHDPDAIRGRVVDAVTAVAREELQRVGRAPHFAGTGVLYEALNRQTLRDSGLFLAVSILLMVVLLRATLGRWSTVLVALIPAWTASIAALGLLAIAGRPMTMVTAALPTLVLVIALSDAIHVISHVDRAWAAIGATGTIGATGATGASWRECVANGVAVLAVPCFHTAITTAIGFAALATSQLAVVSDFGLFAALGLLLAWVLTMAGLVLGLVWRGPRDAIRTPSTVPFVERAVVAVARHRWRAVLGWVAVSAVLVVGVTRLRVDTYTIGLLPPGHAARVDSDWIEARLGDYTPLEFVVHRRDGRHFDADDAAAVLRWREGLRAGDGRTRSVGWPNGGAGYLSADSALARITTFVPMQSARGFDSTARAMLADAAPSLTAGGTGAGSRGLQVRSDGYFPLYVRIVDYVVRGTVSGLVGSVALVMLVFVWLLRSARSIIAALVVNLLPVLLVFGVMGWAKIPLDIATATVGAIVLGIAVDDTIHFFFRYDEARRAGLRGTDALAATAHDVGRPMLVTTLVLSLGFGVMMLSGSSSVASFGLVAMLAIAGAAVSDIGLLPVFLAGDGDAGAGAQA